VDKEELWSRWWRAFPVQPSGWAVHEWSAETLGFETRAERDLMLVLHRPVEPTTQNGHSSYSAATRPDAFPWEAILRRTISM
jgi:hypothetical protein